MKALHIISVTCQYKFFLSKVSYIEKKRKNMKIMQRFPLEFEQKKSFFNWTLDNYVVIIGFQFQKKMLN